MNELVGVSKAAALHGITINNAYPSADRLQAAVQALDIYEQEYDTLTAERNRLRAERDEARLILAAARDADDWDPGAMVMLYDSAIDQRDALAASLDWVRRDTCTMCEQGICSVHQPAAGVIAAAQERLRSGCPAWGPGSGYVHVSEVEMDTLTAERDQLRTELAEARQDCADWERGRRFSSHQLADAKAECDTLAAQLAQAERVVEAARAVLAAATAAMGAVPMDQQSPTSLAVLQQIIGPIIAVLSPALAEVATLDGTAGPDKENQ